MRQEPKQLKKDTTRRKNSKANRNKVYLRRVGSSIRLLRQEAGLKQTDLADAVGLSVRHHQKIEAGQVDVGAALGFALAESLSVEPCYLFRDASRKTLEGCGILCPIEILELLPVGIQVHNIHGEIYYINKMRREQLGLVHWKKNGKPIFIWDYKSTPQEVSRIKEVHQRLLNSREVPSEFATSDRNDAELNSFERSVKWDYIFNNERNVIGFVSVFF